MAGSATPLTATKVTRFRDAEMEREDADETPTQLLTIQNLRKLISSFEMAMDMALEMDPNVDRSCTIIHNVKKDIRAYYEVLEEKRKNAQQMTLDAFITAKPSTPSAPTTPRTSKQNTAFRQLFKTSVKPQPLTAIMSEVADNPGSDNESEVADDPGSEESELADYAGSKKESEVADDPSLLSPQQTFTLSPNANFSKQATQHIR
ncbi:hypothetical protein Hamer_G026464, partial [Homarus americanus]